MLKESWCVNNRHTVTGVWFIKMLNNGSKKRCCVWILSLMIIPYLYIQLTFPVRHLFKNKDIQEPCVIPQPDPFDPSIMQFVWDPEPLVCGSVPSLMFVDDNGFLQFNLSAVSFYSNDVSDLQCFFRILSRHIDDYQVKFEEDVPFRPPIYVPSDFFSVSCKNKEGNTVYDYLLTSIAANSTKKLQTFKNESDSQLSVVLFGLDSVSRSSMIRKLPKTYKYLMETLKAYDFKGFMKIGDNTLPNIVAFETGLRIWTNEVPIKDYTKDTLDSLPFLWRQFSDSGYVTLLSEDMADIATFNLYTRGFHKQPVDHYFRPYYLGLSHMKTFHVKLGYVYRFLEARNVNLRKSSYLCYGDKPNHAIHIEYLKKFMHAYSGKRRFLHSFLAELSHEYQNFLSYADSDIQDFLQWMKDDGHLNNTLLIFFSDHGARIDKIRNTFLGRIEDRMPVLAMYLPDHIKQRYPEIHKSMQNNTRRLTTFYDLHQTLTDILQSNFHSPSVSHFDGRERGISLLRPVPESRSCSDAWIPEEYCACHSSKPVNLSTDPELINAVNGLVLELNTRLHSVPKCAKLKLHKIQEAHQILNGLEHTGTENTGISLFQFLRPETDHKRRYLIVIETVPGHAIFEATYELNGESEGRLIGDITRVNKFGHQADCITEKRLRRFCYCG